jgi:hypothetical protein
MEALLTRGAVAPAAQRTVLQVVDVSWVVEPPFDLNGQCRVTILGIDTE